MCWGRAALPVPYTGWGASFCHLHTELLAWWAELLLRASCTPSRDRSPHRLSACHLQTRGVVTRLHDQRWCQSEVTPVICYVPVIKSQVFRTYGNNCKQLGEVKVHFPESRKSNSSVFWQQEAWGRGWLGGGQVPGGAAWVCLQLICQFQAFLHQGKVGVLSQKSLVSASSCWCSVNVKSC